MLQLRSGMAWVVQPEGQRARPVAPEVADLRVVAVDDELRGRQRRHGRAPAGGNELELAVAVELVAEEVAERAAPSAAA